MKQETELMKKAREKGLDEYDTILEPKLLCPYCGDEELDAWAVNPDDAERECSHCGEKYHYVITLQYSTYKLLEGKEIE